MGGCPAAAMPLIPVTGASCLLPPVPPSPAAPAAPAVPCCPCCPCPLLLQTKDRPLGLLLVYLLTLLVLGAVTSLAHLPAKVTKTVRGTARAVGNSSLVRAEGRRCCPARWQRCKRCMQADLHTATGISYAAAPSLADVGCGSQHRFNLLLHQPHGNRAQGATAAQYVPSRRSLLPAALALTLTCPCPSLLLDPLTAKRPSLRTAAEPASTRPLMLIFHLAACRWFAPATLPASTSATAP
jgi:hypothetical protein